MKTMMSAVMMALTAGTALAHPSVVPHDHPHALSWLPDAGALLLAAFLVGAGIVVFRRFRKS